jgi:hypothetical protein
METVYSGCWNLGNGGEANHATIRRGQGNAATDWPDGPALPGLPIPPHLP